GGFTHDPISNYDNSEGANARGETPVLSMTDDILFGRGHTVRPWKWEKNHKCDFDMNLDCRRIYIGDPNHPKTDPNDVNFAWYIQIEEAKNVFHYAGRAGGTKAFIGGRLLWIPWHVLSERPHTPFERLNELENGDYTAFFSGDGKAFQVSDG